MNEHGTSERGRSDAAVRRHSFSQPAGRGGRWA